MRKYIQTVLKAAISATLAAVMLLPLLPAGIIAASAESAEPLKKRATYFTTEKVANARKNAAEISWASSILSSAKAEADKYIGFTYSEIWDYVPSQEIHRSYAVNQPKGCLNCGLDIDKYGNYPYTYDVINDPWKVTCPSCGMKFPTNDFGAYYKSGLDENGIFHQADADKSLLVNTLYPEKGEKWGVDDGNGYIAPNGEKYFFIAYYVHWAVWHGGIITNMLNSFYNAYLYSGEQKYADAAIVLLNRIADLYPSYNLLDQKWADGFRHSGGDHGKIIGSIWEPGLVDKFIYAYDALFDAFPNMSEEALDFIKSKSNGKIAGYKDIMVNIENGIVKQIFPEVKKQNIYGNNGMHQRVLILAAVVLDDPVLSKEWLDFAFKPSSSITTGLNISATFINDIDRDGMGDESSPGYNSLWLGSYLEAADMLRGYKINGTDISYDLFENVKFKKMFAAMLPLVLGDNFTPNIGDTGSTASHGKYVYSSYILDAYKVYREPIYAQILYWVYGGNISGIHLDIWDSNPNDIEKEITDVVKTAGPLTFSSVNLTGYGFTALRNINNAVERGDTDYSKTKQYKIDEIAVIGLKAMSNVVKNDTKIEFTPASVNDTLSVGFILNNVTAVYDILISSEKVAGAGTYDTYVDGRILQLKVPFPGESDSESKIYFKKTINLTKGYHVISFVPNSADNLGKLIITGLTVIKSGASSSVSDSGNDETSLYMYYGRNSGHGHLDTLNIGLYAFDMDLMPELGYPEFCDDTPHRLYWVRNTVSHNTVIVNDTGMQDGLIAAQPKHYDDSDFVKLINVDASKKAYSAASVYNRTSALIRYDDNISYAVDLFRVVGGNKHTYSFHPGESSNVVTEGLEFTAQTNDAGDYIGTLLSKSGVFGAGSSMSGYQWLKNVRTDSDPDKTVSFDWSLVDTRSTATADDVHLKLTMLGSFDSVVLANGIPPRNKDGNPSQLDYVLANESKNDTLFVSVIEPYSKTSYIEKSEIVPVTSGGKEVSSNDVRAVKVTFKNGRVDYIVYSYNKDAVYNVDGLFEFKGFFGVYSMRGGKVVTYANDAVLMDKKELTAEYTGKVVDFTKEISESNSITVSFDKDIEASELTGRYIYIQNDGSRNASYKILGAEKSGNNYILDIGDVTLIRSYISTDISKGYNYDIKPGYTFTLPLSYESASGAELDFLYQNEKSDITNLTLSHDLKNDAKAGDFVANIFAISESIDALYKLPAYTYSIKQNYGDAKSFEIKDNAIYFTGVTTTLGAYELMLTATSPDGAKTSDHLVTIRTLSKSRTKEQLYPKLTLTDTKENSDVIVIENPETPDSQNNGIPVWFYIIIGVVVVALVGIGVTLAVKKKK
ncbi:MAG: heparinase II/III family protein [Oscillospiraceae bacterium]|nr:heparinase II/III family protein [Oscillospiraceae bacterium]